MDKTQILKEAKETIENIKSVQTTLDSYLLRLEKIVANLEYENLKKEKLLKSDVTNILAVLDKEDLVVEDLIKVDNRKKEKSNSLLAILIFIIGGLLLISSIFITVNKYDPDAKLFNYYTYVYQASNMEPVVSNNSLVLLKDVKNQEVIIGDNIAYKTSPKTIKIVKITAKAEGVEDGYMAASINHNFEDSEEILRVEILGKVYKSFVSLGAVLLVLQDNLWLLYLMSFLVILIGYLINNKSKKY